ncbi:MAG: carboxypeptidase regulatory-like domain-containing protein, partial [Vicinamibacterales bacterium]
MGRFFGILVTAVAVVCAAVPAAAQVQTGSITGSVVDDSGAVLPGANVALSGDRLIGGTQTQVTDGNGGYRFDRLPPGAYTLKFELQGFKTVVREAIRVNATFTATVNVRLEVGLLQETITVTGESPVVDTKSNVQQTVMSQELLEGVPTGRDPWSVAKIIPGLQVSTYDVGGTQGMQQSGITSHGSNGDDKIFAVDGLNINWPGGGGGSTMVYYDQGMFEEVNFQTSAIPAEVAVGGVFMNMVIKEGGNKWRGDVKYFWAGPDTQSTNHETSALQAFRLPDGTPAFSGGNPVTDQYDFNVSGGGAARRDRVWLFMAYRDWRVDKLQLGAKNPDGTNAIDDNRIRNYSGKITWQIAPNHKASYSHNYNNKQRFHRRNLPIEEDRATWIQDQFGYSLAGKYTGVLGSRTVFESGLGYMHGTFPLHYQQEVGPNDIRIEDTVRQTGSIAAPRNYDNPNSRIQFDNTVTFAVNGLGGAHALKVGVQIARQFFQERNAANGDLIIRLNDSRPNAVLLYNTPTSADSYILQTGYFVQDTWTVGRKVTLNLGFRYDTADGWIPAGEKPAGRFDRFVTGPLSISRLDVISQGIAVWRTGVVYDIFGGGRTAAKANLSRYGSNVGIDRVTTVHPFNFTSGTRAWSDPNGDLIPQENELGAFSGFAANRNRYADGDGPDWPHSDELSAGIEHELRRNLRVA